MAKQSKTLLTLKVSVLLLILIGVFFLVRAVGLANLLNPEQLRSFLEGFGFLAPLVFGIIYFFATLAMLSAAALSVLSGILFGPFWGTVIVVVAATLAAMVAFFITHYFGKGISTKLSGGTGVIAKMVQRIEQELNTGGFRAFFLLRCLFLPYIPLSYAAGLVKTAKAKDFFWATFFTNCIFSPFFVILGDSITLGWKAILLPAALIILVLSTPKIIKKLRKKP